MRIVRIVMQRSDTYQTVGDVKVMIPDLWLTLAERTPQEEQLWSRVGQLVRDRVLRDKIHELTGCKGEASDQNGRHYLVSATDQLRIYGTADPLVIGGKFAKIYEQCLKQVAGF